MNYRELIKFHEGYRQMVYLDTVGIPTVGWGHAFFDSPKPSKGAIFSPEQCEDFFDDDMQQVERDYVWLEDEYDLHDIGRIRRSVLKNMLFNLGLTKLRKFKKMLGALSQHQYSKVAEEMLDSKWAKQVGRRATVLSDMMKSNEESILAT